MRSLNPEKCSYAKVVHRR